MANQLLTIGMITKEMLRVLHEKLVFLNKTNTQYTKEFGKKGYQIGTKLDIRKPAQFKTKKNSKQYNPQDFVETSVQLVISEEYGIDVTFSDQELSLSLNDFSKQFIEPAMSQLATDIEEAALSMANQAKNSIYNATGLTYKDLNRARAALVKSLASPGDWCMLINPDTSVEIIDEIKGLFQDSTQIAQQYREGLLGRTAQFDYYESNIVPVIKNPSTDAFTVTVSEGATTAALAGLGANEVIPAGTRFKVAGSFKVHAETKQSYADLYEFVVKAEATADGAGAATVTIDPIFGPAAYPLGARQNISAIPGAASAVTLDGAANEVKRTNIAFTPEAFTFAAPPLEVPKGTDIASVQTMDNLSIRFIRDFDTREGEWISRADIQFGFAPLRPELACALHEPNA